MKQYAIKIKSLITGNVETVETLTGLMTVNKLVQHYRKTFGKNFLVWYEKLEKKGA